MEPKIMFRYVLTCVFLISSTVHCVNYQPRAIPLTEDSWSDILKGEWLVIFMAPWCPACQAFKSTWDNFATQWSRDLEVVVGTIDVTENPGLSGRFLVTALPSIYHVKDGVFRQYHGGRTEKELISYIDDKKWKSVEPVSRWTAPDSIQMSMVGLFFKWAMKLRAFYTLMTDEYGIPEWGCYLIFAILTILLGLFLGLVLVCICDFVMPAKQIPPPIPTGLMDPARDKEGDIIDDTTTDDGDSQVRRRKAQADAEKDSEDTPTSSDKTEENTEEEKKDK